MTYMHAAVLGVVIFLAAASAVAQLVDLPRDARVDKLQEWIAQVERHHPGTLDAAALTVRTWDRNTLADVRDDMQAIGVFVRDPGAAIMRYEANRDPDTGRPPPRVRQYTFTQER